MAQWQKLINNNQSVEILYFNLNIEVLFIKKKITYNKIYNYKNSNKAKQNSV